MAMNFIGPFVFGATSNTNHALPVECGEGFKQARRRVKPAKIVRRVPEVCRVSTPGKM